MRHFILACPSGARRSIPLVKERSSIGRRAGCDIRVDEPGVPFALGFVVCSLGDAFAVAERESAPLWINGEPFSRRLLSPGDAIQIGSCSLIFHSDEPVLGPLPTDLLARALGVLAQLEEQAFLDAESEEQAETDALATNALASADSDSDSDSDVPDPHAAPLADFKREPAPNAQSTDSGIEIGSAWPKQAWGRLIGLAGAQKDTQLWLERDLLWLSCSGSGAAITRRKFRPYLTAADGPAPLVNRQRAGADPVELPDGAIIGIGASVLRFELRPTPAVSAPGSS